MAYTQIKIKSEYRDKLAKLAKLHNRSMANTVEVLIDTELSGINQVAVNTVANLEADSYKYKQLPNTDVYELYDQEQRRRYKHMTGTDLPTERPDGTRSDLEAQITEVEESEDTPLKDNQL